MNLKLLVCVWVYLKKIKYSRYFKCIQSEDRYLYVYNDKIMLSVIK